MVQDPHQLFAQNLAKKNITVSNFIAGQHQKSSRALLQKYAGLSKKEITELEANFEKHYVPTKSLSKDNNIIIEETSHEYHINRANTQTKKLMNIIVTDIIKPLYQEVCVSKSLVYVVFRSTGDFCVNLFSLDPRIGHIFLPLDIVRELYSAEKANFSSIMSGLFLHELMHLEKLHFDWDILAKKCDFSPKYWKALRYLQEYQADQSAASQKLKFAHYQEACLHSLLEYGLKNRNVVLGNTQTHPALLFRHAGVQCIRILLEAEKRLT